METLQNYNWSITIGMCVLGILVLVSGAYFVVWYGKRQTRLASEYIRYYEKIQKVLTYDICEANYDWICRLFDRLDECRYKNPEMREVLLNEFRVKFESIIEKRKNEEI